MYPLNYLSPHRVAQQRDGPGSNRSRQEHRRQQPSGLQSATPHHTPGIVLSKNKRAPSCVMLCCIFVCTHACAILRSMQIKVCCVLLRKFDFFVNVYDTSGCFAANLMFFVPTYVHHVSS